MKQASYTRAEYLWQKLINLAKFLKIPQLLYYYPFSYLGSFSFLISVYLLGYGIAVGNLYALIISVPFLNIIFLILIFIRLWVIRQRRIESLWERGKKLTARSKGIYLKLKINGKMPPYFFRYHVVVRGYLDVGKKNKFYYSLEASSSADGEIKVPIYFPLSGTLEVKTFLLIRDILGFLRTRTGFSERISFPIEPLVFENRPPITRYKSSSMKNNLNQKQADEDKFYMREYIPGDRMKDVNWKASLRIGKLITRISPQSSVDSYLLVLELRNLSYLEKDSPLSLMHLNLLKSWFLSFLQQMLRENPSYRFIVLTNEDEYSIETSNDIDNFGRTLSRLHYSEQKQWNTRGPQVPERFVFSTGFDPSLREMSKSNISYNLFHVYPNTSKQATHTRLLALEENLPWPSFWIFRPKDKALPAPKLGQSRQVCWYVNSKLF